MELAIFRKINGKMCAEVKTLLHFARHRFYHLACLGRRRHRINRILGACVFQTLCIRSENCSPRMNFRFEMVLLLCLCMCVLIHWGYIAFGLCRWPVAYLPTHMQILDLFDENKNICRSYRFV